METSDGSKYQETGDFKYVGGLTVRGSYEFIDENGQTHKVFNFLLILFHNYLFEFLKVVYEADERGFRPTIVD